MAILANISILIVAILHTLFFVLERFVWTTELGQKIFKTTAQAAESSAVLAANQAVYNLVLAMGLIWTVFAKNSQWATPVQYFILLFILVVGAYGALTVGKGIFFLQFLPALFALILLTMQSAAPRINDISTEIRNPPEFTENVTKGDVKAFVYPGKVFADLQMNFYPNVNNLVIQGDAQVTLKQIESLIRSETNWKIITNDSEKLILEAQAVTQFFRFKDYIIIKLVPKDGRLIEIQMRSKSILGKSDFGKNASRITSFLKIVQSQF